MSQANLITSGIEGAIRPGVTYRIHNDRLEELSIQTEGALADETTTTAQDAAVRPFVLPQNVTIPRRLTIENALKMDSSMIVVMTATKSKTTMR